MDLKEAILQRRSIRNYLDQAVPKEMIHELIQAAIWAPSGSNAQPWAFSVIEDREELERLSEEIKAFLLQNIDNMPNLQQYRKTLANPAYRIFYNAPCLLTIYAKYQSGPNAVGDCYIASQNVMLAAHAMGLGSCFCGFALHYLNLPDVKKRYGVAEENQAVAPVMLGYPAVIPPPPQRREPEIIFWK
ncbi:MAG: nitroreductase [Fusobacteriaceae bacterium]|jgi:nitroreductase|nr:nitroreductase [Fusobacteriaceae bacterium]